jgi:hypothetical protein
MVGDIFDAWIESERFSLPETACLTLWYTARKNVLTSENIYGRMTIEYTQRGNW